MRKHRSISGYVPYSHQCIDSRDIRGVVDVLKSDWLTQGPKIAEFEKALCRYTGARYAVVVSSGTAGLHLACLAAGIGKGDCVITSAITFAASANCILYCGATPAFTDIKPRTLNIDPEKIKARLNNQTKAVIAVHFTGLPCEMEEIRRIARARGLVVIEDACHALGAEYKVNGKWLKVGSCRYSDMAVFSFHPVKSIATGEGGAIMTNKKELYEKLLILRNHGITKNSSRFSVHSSQFIGEWYYEMQALGFNYRFTDIQAALGISQLAKIDRFIKRRREITQIYTRAFADLKDYVDLPCSLAQEKSSWHLYVVRLKAKFKVEPLRNKLFSYLRTHGLGVQVHYIPVYWHPYYRTLGYEKGLCPAAEDYYIRSFSLPLFPSLKKSQIKKVIYIFRKSVAKFLK